MLTDWTYVCLKDCCFSSSFSPTRHVKFYDLCYFDHSQRKPLGKKENDKTGCLWHMEAWTCEQCFSTDGALRKP